MAARGPTRKQRQAAARYVRACARILTPEWRVSLSEALAEEAPAEVAVTTDDRTAEIFLSADYYAAEGEQRRELVAHELGHVLVARIQRALEDAETALGPRLARTVAASYEREEEAAVWALTPLLAQLLPLPKGG